MAGFNFMLCAMSIVAAKLGLQRLRTDGETAAAIGCQRCCFCKTRREILDGKGVVLRGHDEGVLLQLVQ